MYTHIEMSSVSVFHWEGAHELIMILNNTSALVQVYNPDGRLDQHLHWWGSEGKDAMLATNFSVPPENLVGLSARPRLGNTEYLDLFLDSVQPNVCLSVCS
jgi:hypothetical protein